MSGVGLEGSVDPRDDVPRRPRSRLGIGEGGGKAILIATISTIVVFAAIAAVVVNAPGWPAFREKFLNVDVFVASLPLILERLADVGLPAVRID